MKKFLDFDGLRLFLANIKTIFVGSISEGSTSGSFQYTTYEKDATATGGIKVKTVSVPVHNVLTTDTAQNISATKTVTTGNKLVLVDAPANDTDAANKKYVDDKMAANDAMSYKGTVGTNGSAGTTLPTTSPTEHAIKVGATYKICSDGSYNYYDGTTTVSQAAKIGDLFIVKSVASSSPYTLAYDYVPSANERETLVKVSDGTTQVTVNTTEQTGSVTFGQAAAKQVDASITAGSTSEKLPTSAAVANYAISGVTAGSGIEVGAKTNGTQDVKIQLSHIGSNGDSDPFAGLKFNTATDMTTPGLAIDNGSGITFDNNGKLIVNVGSGTGLEINGDGALAVDVEQLAGNGLTVGGQDSNQLIVNAGSGITFDESTGALKVAIDSGTSYLLFDDSKGLAVDTQSLAGDGLTIDGNNALVVDTQSLAGDGLTIDGNNALAVDTRSLIGDGLTNVGCAIEVNIGAGLEFANNGKLKVKTGNGITVDANGVAVNVDSTNANGLSVGANGLAMAKGSTSNLGTVKVTNGNGLSIDNTGTISMATAVASTSGTGGSAGAMSAADKEKLDNLASSTTVGKNGITVTKTGNETDIAADINTTKGLAFTGDTEGSKKIGVNVLTDSGLGFDNTTGGLYLESITDPEINALFSAS